MKIVGVILATFAVAFVAFQNCQKAPNANDVASFAVGSQNASEKIDLRSERISEITFNINEIESVVRSSNTYQIAVNKSIKVQLDTGFMSVSSDLDSRINRFCLSETLTSELVAILKDSQVCKAAKTQDGRMCTQAMKTPYAVILTDSGSYSLGSATDGCGSNSIDLCGNQVSILQGFIALIKTKYSSFVCP